MAGDERALEERVDELLLIRDCHGTMAPPVGRPVFSDDELNGMEVPVLYVVGENDGVCDDPRAAMARVTPWPRASRRCWCRAQATMLS